MDTHPMAAAYAAEDASRAGIARAEEGRPARSVTGGADPSRGDHARVGPDRRRFLTAVIFAGVALGSTAHIAIATVAALAVTEIAGSSALAGLPAAAAVAGTALGSLLLNRGTTGARSTAGLVIGYSIGAAGAVASLVAIRTARLPLLIVGVGLSGFGNAAGYLARYVASAMYPERRRGTILGVVTWAATVGSILGPLLVAPFGRLTSQVGGSELAGGFVIGAVFMAAAALLQAVGLGGAHPGWTAPSRSGGGHRPPHGPPIRRGVGAMAVAQATMVMVMTATPLYIHHHGGSLVQVGVVMTAHTVGMFGLAPLVGGAVDRFGPAPVMWSGSVLLGAGALAGVVGGTGSTIGSAVALWTLGVGWSLAFVAGSTVVAGRAADHPGLQGRADASTWAAGGLAGVVSGFVFSAAGYRAVSLLALTLLVVVAFLWLLADRTRRLLPRRGDEVAMASAGDAVT